MNTQQITIIVCIISLGLSVYGAMAAEKKIVEEVKKTEVIGRADLDLSILGMLMIEILPVLILVFTIMVILK